MYNSLCVCVCVCARARAHVPRTFVKETPKHITLTTFYEGPEQLVAGAGGQDGRQLFYCTPLRCLLMFVLCTDPSIQDIKGALK